MRSISRDAGQEGEHVAGFFAQAPGGSRRPCVLDPRSARAAEVAQGERMRAALAFDHRRVHQRGEARAIERRGHGDEAQIGAQGGLRVERQRQAEVAVEAAFVDFVEQHRADARQFGIGLDALDGRCLR